MDGLALGGLLASFLHLDSPMRRRATPLLTSLAGAGLLTLAAIAAVVGLGLPSDVPPWPGITILAINVLAVGLIGLTVVHAEKRATAPLRWASITYLGRISYGLYLYHYFILLILANSLRLDQPSKMPLPIIVLALFLCFLAASVSWIMIEQPILGLKRHFDYMRPGRTSFRLKRKEIVGKRIGQDLPSS
jgi:peptidoglycan/LPS O-acetylase OafA/YrhL